MAIERAKERAILSKTSIALFLKKINVIMNPGRKRT